MEPLMTALEQTALEIKTCDLCGNLDSISPCRICMDEKRSKDTLCVVSSVADLWALERTGIHKGQYHILGGVLSALDGVRPEDLRIRSLIDRIMSDQPKEIILALGATVDGQTTVHYLTDRLQKITQARITRLAHGVPVGGELDYLDDGTIATAMKSRSAL
jgi:recombination protein RecR